MQNSKKETEKGLKFIPKELKTPEVCRKAVEMKPNIKITYSMMGEKMSWNAFQKACRDVWEGRGNNVNALIAYRYLHTSESYHGESKTKKLSRAYVKYKNNQ